MSAAKDRIDACISHFVSKNFEDRDIARRLFLFQVPCVFETHPDEGFELFQEISIRFNVPFQSVRAAGSAQLGYSYFKGRDFVEKKSDLDIAIVSPELFQHCSGFCYAQTNRYTDRSGFTGAGGVNGRDQFDGFIDGLARGYFRPDFMPASPYKASWMTFFNKLTDRYFDIFKFRTITAGVYLNEAFFSSKQASVMAEFRKAAQ